MASEDKEENSGGKTVLMAGKVSNETYNEVEEYRKERGITRSQVVADAVGFYVHSIECIKCGSLNHPDGKKCSVCGAKLYSEKEIKARGVFGLNPFPKDSEEFKELISRFPHGYNVIISKFLTNGYLPEFSLEIKRTGEKREYLLRLTFRKDDLSVTPSGSDITAIIPPENIYAFVNSMGDLSYYDFNGVDDLAKLHTADSHSLKKLLYG